MTLTELSYHTRKLLPLTVFFVILLLIFFYTAKLLFIYLKINQPVETYINPAFGMIKPPMLKEASKSAGFDFVLDTIEGKPITATESAKVYFLPQSTPRFGYREKIYLMAKTFGIDTSVVKQEIVDKEVVFSDNRQKLTIDITNFNFRYDYYFESEPELFSEVFIPSKKEIENKAIDFLTTVGRYPEELARGKININLFHFDPLEKRISPVFQASDANLVEVNFYRPDIDNIAVVTPGFPSSQNYVIFVFFESGYKVVRAQVKFFEKSEEQVGIYPLKTGDEAWAKLLEGEGFVIHGDSALKKDIRIKNMFLAYLDPDKYENYLQPVYVFLGDPNFVAYVPAISNEYLAD